MNPQAAIEPNTAPLVCSSVRTRDIIPGRGKVDHEGNVMFRKLVAERVAEYKHLQHKGDRPGTLRLVRAVIDQVRLNGGRFLDKNWKNEWVEMSEKERIDKADRALRDASRNVAKRSLLIGVKKHSKQQDPQHHKVSANDATVTGIVRPPVVRSNPHAEPAFDETIFDIPPEEVPSSRTIQTPQDLEYSCGSLFEAKTAMDFWGHNSSNSSLSVTDLISEAKDEETDDSLHSLHKFVKPMVDSSTMSLDLLSLEQQQQQQQQQTSVDWLEPGKHMRSSGLIDEDMLVDSFNQSLDFNHRTHQQQKQRHPPSSSS